MGAWANIGGVINNDQNGKHQVSRNESELFGNQLKKYNHHSKGLEKIIEKILAEL